MTDSLNDIVKHRGMVVLRYSDNGKSTQGLMFLNGCFACHTLEDEGRDKKVYGETRIPSGRYPLSLRKEGRFHEYYRKRFPDMHRGMLHIENIPGFEYVLIHIGNTDKDTAGCILVGSTIGNNMTGQGVLHNSTEAYQSIYPLAADMAEKENTFIHILDLV